MEKLKKVDLTTIKQRLTQQIRTDQLLGLHSLPLIWPTPPTNTKTKSGTRSGATASTQPLAPIGSTPDSPQDERLRLLNDTQVKGCTKCDLCKERTQTVFGQGNAIPRLVFVGEAPGYEEDQKGLAFVGRAGQLLTKIISAMGLSRDDVFICNVLKCRPPQNRDPSAEEILACGPYLRAQLEILQPEVLVALGSPAAKTLLHTSEGIGRLRGRFHDYFLSGNVGDGPSIPLMPTYHPAYLLRSPSEKGKAWEDMQQVMSKLGLVDPRQSSS